MSEYLVELYLPRDGAVTFDAAVAAAAAAADGLAEVRYVRSYYAPDDETCFHVYRAPSPKEVAAALRHLATRDTHISEVLHTEPDKEER